MLSMLARFVCVFALLAATVARAAEAPVAPTSAKAPDTGKPSVVQGKLGDALYTVLIPGKWNGKLLLVQHGLSDPALPLAVDLNPTDEPYKTLVPLGWMIASSSYRRNGGIVRDAITDVEQLYAHLVSTYGAPRRTLLMGGSMGAAITARLAENDPKTFAGALILGGGVELKEPAELPDLTYTAKVPLLFMVNQSEKEQSEAYVKKATANGSKVGLWEITRNGHVKFSHAEYISSVLALDAWVGGNHIDLKKKFAVELPEPASSAKFTTVGAQGTVKEVGTDFGNLGVSFVGADFAKLGIAYKEVFQLEAGGKTFNVTYADTYTDVPTGQWVCFKDADGFHVIAVCFGNAAKEAGVKAGDALVIHKK